MTTRRRFIQALAAAPALYSFRHAWAKADPSRMALVIGNGRYREAPLVNPANDARAFGNLLTQAGFTVDSRVDAGRADMLAAIERFAAAVKRSDCKLGLFYYAGHGAQLDWRNFLLPVDAVIERAEHLRERCVDLGALLGPLSAVREKTFVIILDACRNNPFGRAYRPEQKGLSQFDAPPGSLLAYATSPGNVAADGEGQNGLYTENLVREFGVRGARIEDALKRVRLNVRLASRGEQVPWETTSLEGDVFIFEDGAKKLGEAEMEKLVEADIAEWTRIKTSKKVDDWVAYLRAYPNGRFAEIAQIRLARLLADVERERQEQAERESAARAAEEALRRRAEEERARLAEAERQAEEKRRQDERRRLSDNQRLAADRRRREEEEQAAERRKREDQERAESEQRRQAEAERQRLEKPRPAPGKPAAKALAIELAPGLPVPLLIEPSANPYSAGRYPLGRVYSVGDTITRRQSDILTGIVEREFTTRITRVEYDEDRVEYNDGGSISDLMGNSLKIGGVTFDVPVQSVPAEIQVGRKWTAAFRRTERGVSSNAFYDYQIVRRETITVPAGTFDTFRIEGIGWNTTFSNRVESRLWIVPGLISAVRLESTARNKFGQLFRTERVELVSLKQHAADSPCVGRGGGLTRNLSVKSKGCG